MSDCFVFKPTPPDTTLLPQLSRVLRAVTETRSRSKLPRLWSVTDSLRNRTGGLRRHNGLLGLVNYLLGLLLMIPGLTEPEELRFALIVGACGWLSGVIVLRRQKPGLLAVLCLISGGLLTLGGLLNPGELGGLLIPGVLSLALALSHALFRKRKKRGDSFDRAARQLLDARRSAGTGPVTFSTAGMSLPGQTSPVAYTALEAVYETAELLVPVWQDRLLLLQKSELTGSTWADFRSALILWTPVTDLTTL